MNLKEDFPMLATHIANIPNDGKGTALALLPRISATSKILLNTRLQFNGTMEEVLSADPASKFKETFGLLKYLLPEDAYSVATADGYDGFLHNTDKRSGARLSKLMSKTIQSGNLVKLYDVALAGGINVDGIRSELSKLPSPRACETYSSWLEKVVQNFFSELALITSQVYGISTNVWSFLNAATSVHYSSCFSLNGCNSRGPLHIALNPYTAVIYCRAKTGITGRAWVLFDKSFEKFAIMRSYGFISSDIITKLCTWICHQLNPKVKWYYSTDTYSSSGGNVLVGGQLLGWYIDPVKCIYSTERNASTSIILDNPVSAPCILCGRDHRTSDAICPACMSEHVVRCTRCGKRMFVQEKNGSGVYLCEECITKKITCPTCGTLMLEGGQCPKCSWEHVCSICGTPHTDKTKLMWVNNYPICKTCADILLKGTCDSCGHTGLTYPYKQFSLCKTCFDIIAGLPPKVESWDKYNVPFKTKVTDFVLKNSVVLNVGVPAKKQPEAVLPKGTKVIRVKQHNGKRK